MKIRCPECRSTKIIPYDSPELSDSTGDMNIASWPPLKKNGRRLVLTNGKYKCPKCEKMQLIFSNTGLCWD
jgi:ribosomal protein S27E